MSILSAWPKSSTPIFEEMKAQHAKLHPIAKFCATNEHLSSLEAWRRAISLTAGRNRASYHITHLHRALAAYVAWRTSTSGVEQNFNLRDWLAPKRRNLDKQTDLDHLTIVTRPSSDSVDDIAM